MKKYIPIFLLFLLSELNAVTYVYFQNNSSLNFSVTRSQYGTHVMSAGEWGFTGNTVSSWQRKTEVLWTNRDQGVHNGDDFYFDIVLRNGSDSFTLKLHLNGNFVGSDMWQSASGPGFNHSWYNDRNFHSATFSMGGKQYTLKYTAVFTGGDDDIEYALQEEDPWPIAASDIADNNVFNVLAYNIYMLTPPIALTDQTERAREIWKHVHGYDAFIFSEAFYNSARDNELIPGLLAEYPYMTPVVDEGTFNDDGGVFIASRWPIDTFAQIVYSDCDGSDCLAAKGVMYAKINKNGRRYHLFGTHTQAWNDPQNVSTRVLQFLQLRNFIQNLNIPANEAVIIGGDLNVDKIVNNLNEYPRMLDSLNLLEPQYIGNPNTYDGNLSYYCDPYFEYLDYVMTKNDYFSPYSAVNEVIILRSIADDMWDIFDLSDHFAVRGRFVFPTVSQQPAAQQLCENETFVLTASFTTNGTVNWYHESTFVGSGDSLILNNISLSDSGQYYALLTYNNGQISTDTVSLTVSALPQVQITLVGNYFYSNLDNSYNHQWFLDGQPISGENDTSIYAMWTGVYSLQVSQNGCVSDFSNSIPFSIVSNDFLESPDVHVFPNPATDFINIHCNGDFNYSLQITDIHSNTITLQRDNLKGTQMEDISELAPAVYILRIHSDNKELKTIKLIKL